MAGNGNWFQSVTEYVQETGTNTLDLEGEELGIHEVQYVLNILRDSEVTELNLKGNRLTNGMVHLSSLLIETKISKLNVSQCHLTKEDLLRLTEVLKDSQITDLDVSKNGRCDFSLDESLKYVSHLKRSKLTTLFSNFFKRASQIEVSLLFREFLSSSITNLDLTGSELDSDGFRFLFENFRHSSVTDLNLRATQISPEGLRQLSWMLADAKIKTLNLGRNNLKDDDLGVLASGLLRSTVIALDLTLNLFSNLRPLFTKLQHMQMRTLNLSYNYCLKHEKFIYPDLRWSSLASLNLRNCLLSDEVGEGLMESLRFSNVTKLDVSWNSLESLTVKKFVENVRDFNLTDLDLSRNIIRIDSFFMLGRCLKESKLTRISLNDLRYIPRLHVAEALSFLKLTEGSSISCIEMNKKFLFENDDDCCVEPICYIDLQQIPSLACEQKMLSNTTFTELQLASKNIRCKLADLVTHLKYTNIAHLNLAHNGIQDSGALALGEGLRTMRVRRINLNHNLITSEGAKALAVTFKDSRLLYLHLKGNKIGDDGLQYLAENAKDTLISVLDVTQNPGKKVMLVNKVLWENNTAIQREVGVFKPIVPKTINGDFCFDQNVDDSNVGTFLEKYLWFCKAIIHDCAIGVLLREATPFSEEQILWLMTEKFPLQLSEFIALRIETDASEHVNLLKIANEMGLTVVVRALLYNRGAYLLDKENNILHPYVYKLLHKYDQPIHSLVEPGSAAKIIKYFTEHPCIEGAQDIISLLRSACTS